jgi:hypothetical protein
MNQAALCWKVIKEVKSLAGDVDTIEEEKEEVGRFTDVMLLSYH